MAWIVDEYKNKGLVEIGAGASNAPISRGIPVRKGDSPIIIDVVVASGTGTLKLQDSSNGFSDSNVKGKTVSITGAGTFSLTLFPYLVADQSEYPLRNTIQVLVDATTNLSISEVRVISER